MAQLAPFNLKAWIDEHRHLLKPPVGNALLWNGSLMVMVVGGPNQRSDYHINPGEELYHQIEGDIVLRIMEDGRPRDLPIRQGDIFLLPGGIPHSPQRPAGTVGLVVEHVRPAGANDRLRWFCPGCGAVLHDAELQATDLAKQLKPILERFHGSAELRTCKKCGVVLEVPGRT